MKQKELTEAIDLLEEALYGGKIQERVEGDEWGKPNLGTMLLGDETHEYRTKPEPREWWLCWDDGDIKQSVYDSDDKVDSNLNWDNEILVREVL